MDKVDLIFASGRNATDIIADLKVKTIIPQDWSVLRKEYEPTLHKIVKDNDTRNDKVRSDGTREVASRIHIGLEKLLVKRMTEFMFAIPVKRVYHNIEGSAVRNQIANAIEAIYKHARIDSENIKRGTAYFADCEAATVWYATAKPNALYGFNSNYKLKCKTYSPMDGVRLYPLIDERGDMLAMSFEYKRNVVDTEVLFFETYTANRHVRWKQAGNGWEPDADENIKLMKIPCVYIVRQHPIWHGLSHIRQEIEYTLSRNSDVIAYNSAPILMVSGEIKGGERKGESRRVYRVENGGGVSYVSWAQSIEALKYHVDTMFKLFWMQSQMPDVSFDNMSSLGNIGFDARQMLLTDAHLKVGDESPAWIEFFEREANVIKEFVKLMNKGWEHEVDGIEIEHVISPYIQNDESATVDRLLKSNGGKPIMSQIESIQQAGYSSDPQSTLEQIQKEEANAVQVRIGSVFDGAAI